MPPRRSRRLHSPPATRSTADGPARGLAAGSYTWPNGNVYDGEWRDGKRAGRGELSRGGGGGGG